MWHSMMCLVMTCNEFKESYKLNIMFNREKLYLHSHVSDSQVNVLYYLCYSLLFPVIFNPYF